MRPQPLKKRIVYFRKDSKDRDKIESKRRGNVITPRMIAKVHCQDLLRLEEVHRLLR